MEGGEHEIQKILVVSYCNVVSSDPFAWILFRSQAVVCATFQTSVLMKKHVAKQPPVLSFRQPRPNEQIPAQMFTMLHLNRYLLSFNALVSHAQAEVWDLDNAFENAKANPEVRRSAMQHVFVTVDGHEDVSSNDFLLSHECSGYVESDMRGCPCLWKKGPVVIFKLSKYICKAVISCSVTSRCIYVVCILNIAQSCDDVFTVLRSRSTGVMLYATQFKGRQDIVPPQFSWWMLWRH